MDTTGSIFKRNLHLIFFVIGVIALAAVLYILRSALLPFVLGLLLAYLLMPIIQWVERKLPHSSKGFQTRRVALIVLLYLIILILIGLLSFYIITAVVDAFSLLIHNAPQFIFEAIAKVQEWFAAFRQQLPSEIQEQVDEYVSNAGVALGNVIQGFFSKAVSFIPTTASLVFGLAALPVFLFYLLKDWEKLRSSVYSSMPGSAGGHTKNIMEIIERILGRYIRAQLLLGLFVACLCFVGLSILRIKFAPVLAIFAGLTELIPILGPWIGGAAAVIVTLATASTKAIWVALLYLTVQLLENNLLVPRIQGAYLRIHPALVIVLLVLGAYIAGFWGLVLSVPLAACVIEVYKYWRDTRRASEVE